MTDVETTLNTHLAVLLDRTRRSWTVKTEQTQVMKRPARLDLLVTEEGWPRVIIECKIGAKPEDVAKRFDNRFKDNDTIPNVVFEVKYDLSIGSAHDLKRTNVLRYCVHYDKHTRFPRRGWLIGSVRDLSVAIQYGRESVKYTKSVDTLGDAITKAAEQIGKTVNRAEISRIMAQDISRQTDAMAALTLAGALAFHDMAAGSKSEMGILPLGKIIFGGAADIAALLDAWGSILEINYFPIFGPARDILARLPADKSPSIIGSLHAANSRIRAMGLSNSPDLHGQVFQRVIDDRKRLAAFYTKPVAAALLAAVTIPDQWRDAESIKNIRVADFACGTGALLLAAYRRIAANYEAASGRSMRDIHSHMMAKCLIGADVLPIAAHLTAAGLTAIYPKQRYDTTRIHQPAQGGKDSKIGSLEWIKPNATLDHSENRLTGTGMRGEVTAPAHGSHNIVLMNPPYVRSQGPGGRSDQTDMRQMFTAFGATSADRSRMSARASKLFKNPPGGCPTYCADKRAGMATFFMDLAHAKLGGGGYLGMILPMTAATGVNWRGFREIVRTQYTDLVVMGGRFSADTGMEEIIMSARKLDGDEKPSGRGVFVSLDRPPGFALEGVCAGMAARDIDPPRLEDAPRGGRRIKVGNDEVGTAMDCPTDSEWSVVNTSNYVLPQIAYHIRNGRLYAPPSFLPTDIHTIPLRDVARIGPSHLQIRGGDPQPGRSTSYSGPFSVTEWRPGCLYPALWNNDSKAQRQMVVSPDRALEPRHGSDDGMVGRVWDTASHLHMNLDTRTTSQCLVASCTTSPVVGGAAWPSIDAPEECQRGLAVWCNSTLGILCRWAMSNHEQSGRSRSSRTAILDLPVLEPASLKALSGTYDEFSTKPFDRIANLWRDETRIAMDNAMLERLRVDANLDYIRLHLCAEPSVNGGKVPADLKEALEL